MKVQKIHQCRKKSNKRLEDKRQSGNSVFPGKNQFNTYRKQNEVRRGLHSLTYKIHGNHISSISNGKECRRFTNKATSQFFTVLPVKKLYKTL